jgi:hypothetical protein
LLRKFQPSTLSAAHFQQANARFFSSRLNIFPAHRPPPNHPNISFAPLRFNAGAIFLAVRPLLAVGVCPRVRAVRPRRSLRVRTGSPCPIPLPPSLPKRLMPSISHILPFWFCPASARGGGPRRRPLRVRTDGSPRPQASPGQSQSSISSQLYSRVTLGLPPRNNSTGYFLP